MGPLGQCRDSELRMTFSPFKKFLSKERHFPHSINFLNSFLFRKFLNFLLGLALEATYVIANKIITSLILKNAIHIREIKKRAKKWQDLPNIL